MDMSAAEDLYKLEKLQKYLGRYEVLKSDAKK